MKKIIVAQNYNANKGNASVLYTLVENIYTNIPNIEVEVSAFEPNDVEKLFSYKSFNWPFNTKNITQKKGVFKIIQGVIELFCVLIQLIFLLFIKYNIIDSKNTKNKRLVPISKIASSNLLVYSGGHLFTNLNNFWVIFSHFYPSLICRLLSVKYVIIGQTIGPFYGKSKYVTKLLTKYVLNNAICVYVRDNQSLRVVENLNIKNKNINKTNEIVFLFPEDKSNDVDININFNNERPVLAVTLHHIYYKRWMSKNEYINHLTTFLNHVREEYNFNILFISMEKNRNNKSDKELIREVISNIRDKNNIKLIDLPFDPRYTIKLLDQVDFLYATKTHSVIYGLLTKTPTLAIAYDQKTKDFMNDFNLGEFSPYLENIDTNHCIDLFKKLVDNNSQIVNTIETALEKIKKQSFENIDIIKNLVDNE